jgi:integrase
MRAKLTASTVAQAKATATITKGKHEGKPTALLIWDTEVKGFGLRVTPDGVKSYVLQYATSKHAKAPKRRYTIGRHGSPWTPDAARRRAKVLLGEIEDGHDPAAEREAVRRAATVADLVDEFGKKVLDRREGKQESRRHLAWFRKEIGHVPLPDLDNVAIARLRDKLEAEPAKPRHGKPFKRTGGTVNRYLASLSTALTFAARELNWIERNPMLGKRVKRLAEPDGRVRFLSEDERKRLLAECVKAPNRALYPIVVLALSTGMRQAEVMGLRWPDVDLKRGWITLLKTKNKRPRGVPLVGAALTAMKNHAKVRRLDTDLVFPTARGSAEFPRGAWEQALADAGITNFHFHDTRHTAATYLLQAGVDFRTLADVLGHRTLQMVMRYAHVDDKAKTAAVRKMNAKVFGKEGA